MSETYLSRKLFKEGMEILPDFIAVAHFENGYTYIKYLKKGNWQIWKIKEGYQAARLIDNGYKDHHTKPFEAGALSSWTEAQQWVNKKIEEGLI